MKERKLLVSASPHIRGPDDIPRCMWSVVAALLPALIGAFLFFGWRSLVVVGVSSGFASATEFVIQKLRRVRVTVSDGSALVAGVLLAFTLPPDVPLYVPAVGAVFAMAVAKHAFGGLGMNIWNPALAARAFLLASFPTLMVRPEWPVLRSLAKGDIHSGSDSAVVTCATPLTAIKEGAATNSTVWEMALGWIPGSLGETSSLALLIGGLFLILRNYVDWRVPVCFIGTVAVLVFVLPGPAGSGSSSWFGGNVPVHVFGGGLFLGAFFMATDMVTTPVTCLGRAVFGAGCGLFTALIRLYGGYPEGVCYSILIMNTFVPAIDRLTEPRKFGG